MGGLSAAHLSPGQCRASLPGRGGSPGAVCPRPRPLPEEQLGSAEAQSLGHDAPAGWSQADFLRLSPSSKEAPWTPSTLSPVEI